MDTLFQRQVAHLVQWAQNPGTVDHAKHRARELEACQSGCQRRLNIEPPCRFNSEPGRVANS